MARTSALLADIRTVTGSPLRQPWDTKEVIGDATDRIHRALQITPAITVEIHRPPVKAGGHELT